MQTIILSLSAFQFLDSQKAHFGLLKAVDTASCTEISAKATGVFKGLAKGLFSSPKVSNLMDNIIKVMIQVCFMNKYS